MAFCPSRSGLWWPAGSHAAASSQHCHSGRPEGDAVPGCAMVIFSTAFDGGNGELIEDGVSADNV